MAKTKLERFCIQKRLKGKILSPVRSLPSDAFPYGRPFPVTTKWNIPGSNPPWSLRRHTGADYACPEGMNVISTFWGKVVWVGTHGGWSSNGTYGLHVIVRTRDGKFDHMVAHLSSTSVKVGQSVRPGTILGKSGSTGNVSGPHVHTELRPADGRFGSDVNPRIVRRKI